jgi:hypothetical protein
VYLLDKRWTAGIITLLVAGLLLAAGAPVQPGLAQDEQAPPDQQDEEQPAAQAGEQDETESDEPEPRRLPPRTDAEERSYKLARTQNDPFLLDQLSGDVRGGPGEFYDPLKSVLPVTVSDLSRYIIQDDSGQVLGHLEISLELERSSGLFQLELLNELPPATGIRVIGRSANLDVLSTEHRLLRFGRPVQPGADESAAGVSPLQQLPRSIAEYSYDRIEVRVDRGGVVTHARLRELPFSFDRDVLPLLLRQVDYQNIAWPFEAVATDTSQLKSLPMALDKPQRVTVMSAEPRSYYCFESGLRVGADTSTWWVEQVPPHRLVKFRLGDLTYTLERYVAQ